MLALLFPVLDTYSQPFEVEMYWIQHGMMHLVPILLAIPENISPPAVNDVTYPLLSYSIFFLYHFIILQPIAVMTGVNLDFILCPAPNDPFAGQNYIFHATWTQLIVIFAVSKVLSLLVTLSENIVNLSSVKKIN